MPMPFVLIAFALGSAPGVAAPPQQPGAAPFLGQWKLDNQASGAGGAAPDDVTAEFADGGDGHLNTTYVIAEHGGRVRRMTSRERLDGNAVPIAGDQTIYDRVAMTSPAPGVLMMSLSKSGALQSVRVYTVAADGHEMIESATLVGDDHQPKVLRFRWVR